MRGKKNFKAYQTFNTFFFLLKKENFFYILGITSLIVVVGSSLFYFLENKTNKGINNIGDALYWAIISMTTTGYGDITPLTTGGKIMAAVVVFSGLILLSVATATIASVLVEKKIREGKGLEAIRLKDHLLLCGWNNNAQEVIESLIRSLGSEKISLVLINELNEDELESLKFKYRNYSFKFLRGNFTREEVLARANIAQAKAAIILADTSGPHTLDKADERTILATLAIKSMAPEVKTCAELLNAENKQHLQRAQVDEIIVRGEHIGNLLAGAAISPGLPRVLFHLLSPVEENNLWKVAIPACFIGKSVRDLADYFRKEHQALLIALLTEQKGLSLEEILTDDMSAIEQFIKKKFAEAEKDYLGKKERIIATLNPADDRLLSAEDSAVVIARKKP
ncbi:MAG: potassium channel family protein [Thermodesulfobacteriota bacterium]